MSEHKNPFLEPYGTLHDTVPFDRIRLEDYEEAFMEGIRRDNEYLEKTINNPEKPTFDNTILNPFDEGDVYYDLLDRVSTVFFNLLSAETNDDMDALAQKMQPILTKHANDMRLNPQLFERIRKVHLHHRRLTPEEQMLLNNCYEGFVRSGALLDEEGKAHLRQLTEEASMLSLQFSQNLLKENKAFTLHITDEAQLDGLPDTAREAARQTAKEQDKEGWVFTSAPSVVVVELDDGSLQFLPTDGGQVSLMALLPLAVAVTTGCFRIGLASTWSLLLASLPLYTARTSK